MRWQAPPSSEKWVILLCFTGLPYREGFRIQPRLSIPLSFPELPTAESTRVVRSRKWCGMGIASCNSSLLPVYPFAEYRFQEISIKAISFRRINVREKLLVPLFFCCGFGCLVKVKIKRAYNIRKKCNFQVSKASNIVNPRVGYVCASLQRLRTISCKTQRLV